MEEGVEEEVVEEVGVLDREICVNLKFLGATEGG